LQYFNTSYLIKKTLIEKSKSLIYNSILKNGYSNFTLDILEYCTADYCIDKEQYYINLLKPEYNLLAKAGSWLGYKHTEKSLAKMAASHLGKTH
jgi:group I intron endonuclease